MGRKKALGAASQQVLRPFCFFCDRTFDDETVLLQHQRAKHFRCPECDDGAVRGKCESVQGLIVHTLKVHGKSLSRVPNALQGRDNPELNVYGMDGIPSDLLAEKGFNQPRFSGDQAPPPPKPAAAPSGVPPGMLPPGLPSGLGIPALQSLSGMPPALPGIPPALPPPALPAMAPELPGMLPGFPGMVDLGAAAAPGDAPVANGTMPAPMPSGPSLEGFQQFLAQQGLRPPGFAPEAPPPVPVASTPLPADVPAADVSRLPALPPPGPSLPGLLSGTPDGAVASLKRPASEELDEDVSVEEKRARLPRYCTAAW